MHMPFTSQLFHKLKMNDFPRKSFPVHCNVNHSVRREKDRQTHGITIKFASLAASDFKDVLQSTVGSMK